MFIYFWEKERERESVSRGSREGDTASKAGSRLRTVSTEPDMGLELMDREIMTWAKVRGLTDCTIQAPHVNLFLIYFVFSQFSLSENTFCLILEVSQASLWLFSFEYCFFIILSTCYFRNSYLRNMGAQSEHSCPNIRIFTLSRACEWLYLFALCS